MKQLLSRLSSSLVLALITLVFVVTAMQYAPASRTVPLAVAAVTLILLALDMCSQGEGRISRLVRRAFGGAGATRPGADAEPGDLRKEIAAFLWIISFTALAVIVGFYLAVPTYVMVYLWLHARRPALVSASIALCLTVGLYLLFAVLLGYEIFEGLIFGGYM